MEERDFDYNEIIDEKIANDRALILVSTLKEMVNLYSIMITHDDRGKAVVFSMITTINNNISDLLDVSRVNTRVKNT